MIEKTKQVNKVVLRDNVLEKVIHAELYKTFREMLQKTYDEHEKKFFSEKWIAFSVNGQKGYWNKGTNYAVPVFSSYSELKNTYFDISAAELDVKAVRAIFDKDCPAEIMNAVKASKSFESNHWVSFKHGSYCVETGQFAGWDDDDTVPFGTVKISSSDFKKGILSQKYTILTDDVFKKAVALLKERKVSDTEEKEADELIKILGIDREKVTQEVTDRVMNNFTMSQEIINLYTEGLLSCDKTRADLENYTKKCIEDVNSGHWELWSDDEPEAEEGQVVVTLEKSLTARNPLADIHWDGLIGIDFGTKSTIVSRRDGKEKITLMRVGTGQLSKETEAYHYENPTIMEFINLEKFLDDYDTRDGRPETSVDDLRVSHTANNDLKSCSVSDEFYSYFYDIKQWCGDTERNVKIIDKNGVERILPAFVSLDHDEFNPLEIYAYYLGLYINNMRNGIYLDYILSFPVTYEKTVKEKILESFTKGLKKSLPETVLNDEEAMKQFRVRQGVSEPAAYAITALQGYGFEPDEDEKVLYSIFDFGGGTTDFDFGLWRAADEDNREEEAYDYVIEHFGSEGDRYLGGENLLELMAFEVFKANARLLGKSKEDKNSAGFSFSKPKECDEFAGSETLISDSQEARRNTKQLMEALRPFWEGIIDTAKEVSDDAEVNENEGTVSYKGYIFKNTENHKFPIKDGAIDVYLFDKDGKPQPNQKIYIENKDAGISVNLVKILEERIERGVKLFFNAASQVFGNRNITDEDDTDIQIFLAGNSSKSPVLINIFDRYISDLNTDENFNLFPPLGTEDAAELQNACGIVVADDITAPTGKTGVAYGLIEGRKGGKIKVISEIKADAQTKFRYNVGISKRKNFVIKLDRNKVAYGEWVRFINAREEDFEIYYTSSPVSQDKVPVNSAGIYNKRCRLEETSEDADIYIRCVEDSPEDIEYCISAGEPKDDVKVMRVHLGE